MISEQRLAEIEKRNNNRIKGPYVAKRMDGWETVICVGPVKKCDCGIIHKGEICKMEDPDCSDFKRSEINATAKFFAEADKDIPDLLAYIRELQQSVNFHIDNFNLQVELSKGQIKELQARNRNLTQQLELAANIPDVFAELVGDDE